MSELADYFGERAFPPKVQGVVWRIISPISRGDFERVIEALLEEHRLAPTPGQIKRAALPYLARAHEQRRRSAAKELNGGEVCRFCGNSGLMVAISKASPDLEFGFACSYCRAPEVYRFKKIPLWTDEAAKEFLLTRLAPDDWLTVREMQNKHLAPVVAKNVASHPKKKKKGPVIVDPSEWAALAKTWLKPKEETER